MDNRKRNQRIVFRVSDSESEIIDEKMKLSGILNREAYLRKMAIDGFVVQLDLAGIDEMISLLRNATNNLNQLTKRAHETGNVYKEDIQDLQERYDKLWGSANSILSELARL